jgi:hypothetical protein
VVGTCEHGNEPLVSIKPRKIFRLPEELLASQAGLCSMEIAGWLVVSC